MPAVWGKQHIDKENWTRLDIEISGDGLQTGMSPCSILLNSSIRRILIPEATGGTRSRHGWRFWKTMDDFMDYHTNRAGKTLN